jgi:SAM-dependent methyltransferase
MVSKLRKQVFLTMSLYRSLLEPDNKGWKCLEVGTDGDEYPSGNFTNFGTGNNWSTMDILSELQPTYVADLSDTKINDTFDLIIVSQTLEHIFEYQKAISECYRMLNEGGHLIIDCPFNYPYHGQQGYGDYWRMTHEGLKRSLEAVGFKIISCTEYGGLLSSALAKR